MYIRICTYIHICIYIFVNIQVPLLGYLDEAECIESSYIYTYVYMHLYVYTYMYIYIYVYIYLLIYRFLFWVIWMKLKAYNYHTYIHTYICMYIYLSTCILMIDLYVYRYKQLLMFIYKVPLLGFLDEAECI
jgi:hypothetical protein